MADAFFLFAFGFEKDVISSIVVLHDIRVDGRFLVVEQDFGLSFKVAKIFIGVCPKDLVVGALSLQALYDRSDGFYRRQLILTTKDKPLSRVDDPDIAEKMAAEVEGILLWAFEGLQRLVKNGFQFTESDRAKRNRELVKRDNNNVFDFLESEGYIRLKADACTSSKELYEVYRMWCEENSLNAIKARGFSDALIANQRRYNLESTNNIVNSSGRRVRGFVGIEALVQPDLTPNGWRA